MNKLQHSLTTGLLSAMVVLCATTSAAHAAPSLDKDWRVRMLDSVNAVRALNGVGPLKLCDAANRAAQWKASNMATTGNFSHESPDGSPSDMIDEVVDWTSWGENIAYGYSSVRRVHRGWVNSPGHFANLIGPEFTHVGFGAKVDASGRRYWAQEFIESDTC